MGKFLVLFLALATVLPLGGCFDMLSIENRATVLAVGIDLHEEGGLEVTTHIALPHNMGAAVGGGGGGEEAVLVTTIRAASISSAMDQMGHMVDKPLFFGHTRLLVLGRKTAEGGIGPILDFFLRHPEFRRTAWVVVAREQAKKIMEIQSPIHPVPSLYILNTLESYAQQGSIPHTRLEDMQIQLACPAEQAMAVVLEATEEKIQLGGLAAFQDDRMTGSLKPAELQLFLLLTGRNGTSLVHLQNPDTGEMDVCFEIFNSTPRLIPNLEDGRLSFTIDLWVEGNIIENTLEGSLDEEDFIRHLERRLATKLANDCRKVVAKVQRALGTDIFHFAEVIRARFPHYWREVNWQEEFPQIPIQVQVTLHIRRLGMARQ